LRHNPPHRLLQHPGRSQSRGLGLFRWATGHNFSNACGPTASGRSPVRRPRALDLTGRQQAVKDTESPPAGQDEFFDDRAAGLVRQKPVIKSEGYSLTGCPARLLAVGGAGLAVRRVGACRRGTALLELGFLGCDALADKALPSFAGKSFGRCFPAAGHLKRPGIRNVVGQCSDRQRQNDCCPKQDLAHGMPLPGPVHLCRKPID
jgi:hypothetical protein